jgi:hypothetical protein
LLCLRGSEAFGYCVLWFIILPFIGIVGYIFALIFIFILITTWKGGILIVVLAAIFAGILTKIFN